ncbi:MULTISPECIES: hypothetical protein [Vibrio]|uniref:hypothetical protein n=1 Tax=Vibrio TaxID=662 RepID=UPI001A3370E4|nr:hypothetical protein [Vibrio parahaemolyticus]EID0723806.1 hypothetical protein [Vibrio parahaemolyticus]EJG1587705.1 hypothetical protein [Vibrio parahaemolyticus]HCH3521525.1 hypothetical protein [Vibrio parahaemolyticus]HCH6535883.1 hypothetical protein [Vibrio parahaemolyticus]
MGVLEGKVVFNVQVGKWAWVISTVKDNQIFNQSEFIFSTETEAENELKEILIGLRKLAEDGGHV